MIWKHFTLFAIISIVFWVISVVFSLLKKENKSTLVLIFGSLGTLTLIFFTTILWVQLERPPMRTLGETRIWYSIFLPIIGVLSYYRWKFSWFYGYSIGLAILFLILNLAHPENYSKTLMPALQSPWFVPHVIVYMVGYALLAASSLVAIRSLYDLYKKKFEQKTHDLADTFVYLGFAFLTAGLLFGALWAKEAWGHYWTWDPKETWAFLTWIAYLAYIHINYFHKKSIKLQLWILSLAFVILLICWFGINYLPAAQNSVHIYS
jgi:ABC-type transport system involved in cytochrome c biogenesis permease subunit